MSPPLTSKIKESVNHLALSWPVSGLCPPPQEKVCSGPKHQHLTWKSGLHRGDWVKMESSAGPLIQYNHPPDKKRRFRHRSTQREGEDGEVSHLQAKGGGLEQSLMVPRGDQHLHCGLAGSTMVRQEISAGKPPGLWYLIKAALAPRDSVHCNSGEKLKTVSCPPTKEWPQPLLLVATASFKLLGK